MEQRWVFLPGASGYFLVSNELSFSLFSVMRINIAPKLAVLKDEFLAGHFGKDF